MVKKTNTGHHAKKKAKKLGRMPDAVTPQQVGLFSAVILIGALLVISILSNGTFYIFNESIFSKSSAVDAGDNPVLAVVNGEEIRQSELDKHWNALSAQAKMQMTKKQLLDSLVSQTLILQDAKEQGIVVTDEDVDAFIQEQLAASATTEEQFLQNLQAQGTNLEDIRSIIKQDLILQQYTAQFEEANPATEEEILAFYDSIEDSLFVDEMVTVRHILIEVNDQFDNETASALVTNITVQLDAEDNENFCDLVKNYSMDLASVENCGEYTFGKGQMDSAFENLSFELSPGDRGVARSSYGYHIILKLEDHEAQQLALDDVLYMYPEKPLVRDLVAENVIQQKMMEYAQRLQENATIVFTDVNVSDEPEFDLPFDLSDGNGSGAQLEVVDVQQVPDDNMTVEE